MLKVTIHRDDAPSYRTAVLELPEREDLLAEKLEQIGVGVTLEKNCLIEKLEGDGGALQALAGSCINADEMQYLAKRMEGCDAKELLTFRAAVMVEKPTEVKDLINLTFNLGSYTVITDFSDVAKIGLTHRLAVEGCLSPSAQAETDFAEIGRELIGSGAGIVTPYGVLYRNGSPQTQVYNGWQFPEYFCDDREVSVRLSTDERFSVTETIYLPCFDVEIQKALLRLGADDSDCYAELDFHRLSEPLHELFERRFEPAECLTELNELARCYRGFDEQAEKSFHAIVEYAFPANPHEAVLLAQNFWEFTVIPGVGTAEEYGRHIFLDSGRFDCDPTLEDYVDFRGYGEERIRREGGIFTNYGYLAYHGDAPVVAEILSPGSQPEMAMGGL